jgi:hypothetical protein
MLRRLAGMLDEPVLSSPFEPAPGSPAVSSCSRRKTNKIRDLTILAVLGPRQRPNSDRGHSHRPGASLAAGVPCCPPGDGTSDPDAHLVARADSLRARERTWSVSSSELETQWSRVSSSG